MASPALATYNFLLVVLLPFAIVRLFWRNRKNLPALNRWRERLGHYRTSIKQPLWVHAVSVGESNAAEPIITALLETYPNYPILVTTTTATGAQTVMARYRSEPVTHAYYPFDTNRAVKHFLSHFQPRALILMETELWPNMLDACRERNVPVILANGRLSKKAARRYRKFRTLTQSMLENVHHFAIQGDSDANRFIELGAAAEDVTVTGSLKFDREIAPSIFERGESIRRQLGPNRLIMMAGSTRDGEEALLLDALTDIQRAHAEFLLVIAPRHPERFDEVAELLNRRSIPFVRHTLGAACEAATAVYLLDVMGELANFYAASDIAFVGGSLVETGGHNTLEPAGLGLPILVGPYAFNFEEINEKLEVAGALTTVSDVEAFVRESRQLLADSNLRDEIGQAGRQVFTENRGALSAVMSIIKKSVS